MMKRFSPLLIVLAIILTGCSVDDDDNSNDNNGDEKSVEVEDEVKKEIDERYLITENSLGLLEKSDAVNDIYNQEPLSIDRQTAVEFEEGMEYDVVVKRIMEGTDKIAEVKIYDGSVEVYAYSYQFRTEEGIGPDSTIEAFVKAYPDYNLWYTYVSDRYILDAPDFPQLQFVLDNDDYVGDEDKLMASDMVNLDLSDFVAGAKVQSVRLY